MTRGTSETGDELTDTAWNRDERYAARYLGVAIETLRTWRKKHKGPPFKKIGGKAVRYSIAGLQAYVDAQPTGGEEIFG